MAEKKRQGFLKGAALLSIATIAVKLVGLVFSVQLANLIGEKAISYYSVAYDIFALFNAAATAGIPVAVSRMVSEAYTMGRKKQADKIFMVALTSFSVLGLLCSVLMFAFAGSLAGMLGFPGAKYSVMALAPTVFFCAFMSAIRGYFQGRSNMMPTAVSQVIEAVSKLAIGLSLAFYVHSAYNDGRLSAAAAIVGVSSSAALGAIFSGFCKLSQNRRDKLGRAANLGEESPDPYKIILKKLVSFAVPITIGACFIHLLNLIDARTVATCLKSIEGFTASDAEALYGTWANTVKIYDLPGAIIIPLSTSVLPVLTAAYTRGSKEGVKSTATSVLRMTFLIAIPCCAGLFVFANPIASNFYYNSPLSIEKVPGLLQGVSLSVIFNGLLYTTNAIIQALGNAKRPVIHMLIGGAVKIALNYILVSVPGLNIMGVAISTVISNLIVAALNLQLIYKLIPKMEGVLKMTLPMAASAAIMGALSYLVYSGISSFASSLIALLAGIITAVVVYFTAVIIFRAVRAEEIRMLPKGDKIAKLLHMD